MPATRREVLEALERLWDRYPDMRLGQLITNVTVFASGGLRGSNEDVWAMENDTIVSAIQKHLGPE